MKISRITMISKQKWEEKQLYRYYKQQTNEILNKEN